MSHSISILGSTGSIGTQTLDVARWRGWRVAGLAAGKNLELIVQQTLEFNQTLVQGAVFGIHRCDSRS